MVKKKAAKDFKKLKAAMAERGYTQDFMAKLINVNASTFNMKINGRQPWKYDECRVIAIHFGQSTDDLFG